MSDLQAAGLFIFNSRTSLLRAVGNPTYSLQFASRYRSIYRKETLENQSTLFGTPLVVRHPEHGIKVRSKSEFDM